MTDGGEILPNEPLPFSTATLEFKRQVDECSLEPEYMKKLPIGDELILLDVQYMQDTSKARRLLCQGFGGGRQGTFS